MNSTSLDRDGFLDGLRLSGLLGKREFQGACAALPETTRGRVVARALVERGILTKFQAELLLIGRTSGFFLGPYKILDQLGQGGMGRVYKALHQPMNRVVALKVLTPQVVKTVKAQKLFQREVEAAAQLHHPNIVTAYDAGQVAGRSYLAMEFVDGPNCEELVRTQGPLPVPLACELIRQAALGLQHAHEMGMLHRDLKPANLIVQKAAKNNASCVCKILDFGLARLHEPSDGARGPQTIIVRENSVMGTPDFISPEQARDLHKVDIRSDLYSLGCTLYYLLTKEVPFPGGNALEKLVRHSADQPKPLSELRDDVPEAVAELLRKLMAKRPEDRFATPLELATALAPFARPSEFVWDESKKTARISATTPVPDPDERADTLQHGSALTPLATNTALPADPALWKRWLMWAGAAVALITILGALAAEMLQ